jgi:hypothetical protein
MNAMDIPVPLPIQAAIERHGKRLAEEAGFNGRASASFIRYATAIYRIGVLVGLRRLSDADVVGAIGLTTRQSAVAACIAGVGKVDAESALLSSILCDRTVAHEIQGERTLACFNDKRNGFVFDAMMELYDASQLIDPLTVAGRLEERGWLQLAGGKEYIGYLVDVVPWADRWEDYWRAVRDPFVKNGT